MTTLQLINSQPALAKLTRLELPIQQTLALRKTLVGFQTALDDFEKQRQKIIAKFPDDKAAAEKALTKIVQTELEHKPTPILLSAIPEDAKFNVSDIELLIAIGMVQE
jgi:hypothetical protein